MSWNRSLKVRNSVLRLFRTKDIIIFLMSLKKIKDTFMNEVGHIMPAQLTVIQRQKVTGYITQMNNVLGIKTGVGHTEIIMNESGEIELVETHIRMGGGMMGVLMNNSYNCDVVACWGDLIARDAAVSQGLSWNGNYSAIVSAFPTKTGIIERMTIPADESGELIIKKKVGESVTDIDNQNRILSLMDTGNNRVQLKSSLLKRLNQIVVEIS